MVILMTSLGAAAVGLACTSIPEPAGRVLDGAPPSCVAARTVRAWPDTAWYCVSQLIASFVTCTQPPRTRPQYWHVARSLFFGVARSTGGLPAS